MAVYYFVGKPYSQAWLYAAEPAEGSIQDGEVVVRKEFDTPPSGRVVIVPTYLVEDEEGNAVPVYDIKVINYNKKPDKVAELEATVKLQEAQIKAVADYNEFLEDCIAEMATIVYNY